MFTNGTLLKTFAVTPLLKKYDIGGDGYLTFYVL
jgi:hypothetical protein